jgi:hypothetical protein
MRDSAFIAAAGRAGIVGFMTSVLLLSACSSPLGLSSSTLVPEQSAMAYYQWVHSASAEARSNELHNLAAMPASAQALRDVKKALLLSMPADAPDGDAAEAVRLLTAVARNPSPALAEDYRIFAGYWLEELQRRGQLQQVLAEKEVLRAAQEELGKNNAALQNRLALQAETLNSLESQKNLLEQQNRLMQKQIDALTIIEQQLVEQERGGGSRK